MSIFFGKGRRKTFELSNRYSLQLIFFILLAHIFLISIKAEASENIVSLKSSNQQTQINGPNALFSIMHLNESNTALNTQILNYNLPFLENVDPALQNLGDKECGFLYGRYLTYWSIGLIEKASYGRENSKELADLLQTLMMLNGLLMMPHQCELPMGFHDTDDFDYYLKTTNDMQATKWLETAAWQGQKKAQIALAKFYSRSLKYEDKKQAFKWWLMLANAGDDQAIFKLGQFYEDGAIVHKDLKRAYYYYERAADLENIKAVAKLGSFYASGIVVKKDLKKAFGYYFEAAKQHDAESQFYLFKAYWHGYGVEEDKKTAIQWFYKAGSMEHLGSQCLLGEVFFEGNVFKKDTMEAYRLCYMVKLRSDPPHEKTDAVLKRIAQTMNDSDIKAAQKQVHDCLSGEIKACPHYLLPDSPLFGFGFAFENYSNKNRH
ncbi:tetratricopeptide repeat protein [Bartonella sp. HY406]|uniref:tetratricopeptide repeat protein n=1 Tax=Bartonella sp. HY406 TaxID=2979331 RepID=UPI0021C5844B|nr:tetratricopeptide repeat protein [Bartonella sp. HY406]UXN04975.1 sel1 repeat family protein [Bartonella sp. HY406]